MARRTAIPAMVTAMVLLASAACGGGGGAKGSAGANPTLATDPPRTNPTLATVPAPTTTTNPYALPATIDAAYVNRVLAGLDAAVGDIVRLIIQARSIPPEALERMKAVYADPGRLQRSIDGFQRDIRSNFAAYRPNPGNKATLVTELLTGTKSCIFAKVRRDYSAVGNNPPPAVDPQWIALRPLSREEVVRYNPTGWAFVYDGYEEDLSRPNNPCVS